MDKPKKIIIWMIVVIIILFIGLLIFLYFKPEITKDTPATEETGFFQEHTALGVFLIIAPIVIGGSLTVYFFLRKRRGVFTQAQTLERRISMSDVKRLITQTLVRKNVIRGMLTENGELIWYDHNNLKFHSQVNYNKTNIPMVSFKLTITKCFNGNKSWLGTHRLEVPLINLKDVANENYDFFERGSPVRVKREWRTHPPPFELERPRTSLLDLDPEELAPLMQQQQQPNQFLQMQQMMMSQQKQNEELSRKLIEAESKKSSSSSEVS